jgi:hypothetical protein
VTEMRVLPMEPGYVSVEVDEGDIRTAHRVHVPEGFLDQLALVDVDPADVARETIGFLLDRIPNAGLPDEISVYDVARDNDDFTDELLARLS